MGALLNQALAENQTSWSLYTMSGVYWRILGNHGLGVDCLRRALYWAPHQYKDIPLLSMASILHLTGYSSDALVVVEAAQAISDTLYATHLTRGLILAALGQFTAAQEAVQVAITLKPELYAGYGTLADIVGVVKRKAVAIRRSSEISVRKNSLVLTADLTWDDFEYEELEESSSVENACQENAKYSPVDRKCHCNEGWQSRNGACFPDQRCENVKCKGNSLCLAGHCHCAPGHYVVNNECVQDLCEQIKCVEHAACYSSVGLCKCVPPFIQVLSFFSTHIMYIICIT